MSVAVQKMRDDLGWSEAQKGLVLIPASRLTQLYGAKVIFGLSVAIPSLLTLFVPAASRSSFGLALFIRCIIGFFESSSFPALYYLYPIWIPPKEKTLLIPVIMTGMYIGEIIGFSLSGVLVESDIWIGGKFYGGWPSVFYFFGLLGIAWFPFWWWMAYETPDQHPGITKEELDLIHAGKQYVSVVNYDAQDQKAAMANEFQYSANKQGIVGASHSQYNGKSGITNPLLESGGEGYETGTSSSPLLQDGSAPPMSPQGMDGRTFSSDLVIPSQLVDEPAQGERTISLISDDGHGAEIAKRTPWRAFFTHPASLTLLINNFTYGWIGFTLLSEIPSYLTDVLGFNLESAGILSVFPYFALFVSTLFFGKFFKYLQLERKWPTRDVRQWAQFINIGMSSVALIICSFLDNKYAAYTFMIITQVFFGAGAAGIACAYSDVSPNYSGMLNSIGNTIGAIAGIVGPIVVAAFTEAYPGVTGWRAAFFLTAAMSVGSLILWVLFQTSDVVPELNNPAPKRYQ